MKWLGAKTYPSLFFSLEAEAKSLVRAMRCLEILDVEEMNFESDSNNLMKALNDHSL